MAAPLVDTHFHLDLFRDPARVLEQLKTSGSYVIAVTNAPSVYSATSRLVGEAPRVRAALGLHPELAQSHAHERRLMWELLATTRYVGEVGLDYVTEDPAERRLQREVFAEIVARCSDAGDKVLTVHSRRAANDVVEILRGFRGSAILHWFSGSQKEMNAALAAGLYFSVNPAMCRTEKGRRLVQQIPRDRLVTETDGPFVQVGGRPAMPSDIMLVVTFISDLWQCDAEGVKAQILSNLGVITST